MTNATSNLCLNCPNPVATGYGRTGKFCSRSCANTYNNRLKPKRQLSNTCTLCPKRIRSQLRYCQEHSPKNNRNTLTLGELKSKSIRDAQVYNTLRQTSKKISLSMPQFCVICRYDKHVEVAHLRSLSSLPDDTTVEFAVGPHNFVLLCPNHHWELDYGNLADYE